MTEILKAGHSAWAGQIAASLDILFLARSVEVLKHALSTATSRRPQQTLWEAVEPHVAKILTNDHGVSVLALLVRYATAGNVGAVCAAVAEALGERVAPVELIEAVAYRHDADPEESRVKLLEAAAAFALKSATSEDDAVRRYVVALIGEKGGAVGDAFAAKLMKSKPWQTRLVEPLKAPRVAHAVVKYSTSVLQAGFESGHVARTSGLAAALWAAATAGTAVPHSDVTFAVASTCDAALFASIVARAVNWPLLAMLKNPSHARWIAVVLQRAPQAQKVVLGTAIAAAVGAEWDTLYPEGKKPAMQCLRAMHFLRTLNLPGDDKMNSILSAAAHDYALLVLPAVDSARLAIAERLAAEQAVPAAEKPRMLAVVDSDDEASASAPSPAAGSRRARTRGGKKQS